MRSDTSRRLPRIRSSKTRARMVEPFGPAVMSLWIHKDSLQLCFSTHPYTIISWWGSQLRRAKLAIQSTKFPLTKSMCGCHYVYQFFLVTFDVTWWGQAFARSLLTRCGTHQLLELAGLEEKKQHSASSLVINPFCSPIKWISGLDFFITMWIESQVLALRRKP